MLRTKNCLTVPPLRALISNTIDAGIFYEDAFQAACKGDWQRHSPAPENRLPDVVVPLDADLGSRWAERKVAAAAVARSPRGTWCCFVVAMPGGSTMTETFLSDGHGGFDCRAHGPREIPSFSFLLDEMTSMEIYSARKAIERERRDEAALARVRDLRLQVGRVLKNVTVNGTRFSTAVVERLELGMVTALATRRGSKHRWQFTTSALNLVIADPVPTDPPLSPSDTRNLAFHF